MSRSAYGESWHRARLNVLYVFCICYIVEVSGWSWFLFSAFLSTFFLCWELCGSDPASNKYDALAQTWFDCITGTFAEDVQAVIVTPADLARGVELARLAQTALPRKRRQGVHWSCHNKRAQRYPKNDSQMKYVSGAAPTNDRNEREKNSVHTSRKWINRKSVLDATLIIEVSALHDYVRQFDVCF